MGNRKPQLTVTAGQQPGPVVDDGVAGIIVPVPAQEAITLRLGEGAGSEDWRTRHASPGDLVAELFDVAA